MRRGLLLRFVLLVTLAALSAPARVVESIHVVVDAGGADAAAGVDAGATLPVVDAGQVELVWPDASITPAPLVEASSRLSGMDASVRGPKNDPRFTIRWGQAGLCGDEPLERMAQRRAALLSTFIGVRRRSGELRREVEAFLTPQPTTPGLSPGP